MPGRIRATSCAPKPNAAMAPVDSPARRHLRPERAPRESRARCLHVNRCTSTISQPYRGCDLASTIAQSFVGAHRSADHLVEIISRTVFAVDLAVARKRHGCGYRKSDSAILMMKAAKDRSCCAE